MQRRTTYEAAPRTSSRRPYRRSRTTLLAAVGASALTGALIVALTTIPTEPSEAHTRTAVSACMTISDGSLSRELRYEQCLDKVLAWIAEHDGSFESLQEVQWHDDGSGTPSTAAPSLAPAPVPSTSSPAPSATSSPEPSTVTTSPSASPTSTATAPSSPEPSPSAATAAADGFTAPFGSRPVSGKVTCDGQSNVTITGKTFRSIGDDTPAITVRNCHNVRIVQNDFIDDAEPVFVTDSTDVTIEYNRYRNIAGPHERNGSNRGNFTQWVNSTGGSISHNTGIGGDTEDIISIYKSGGPDADHPLVIAENRFEGTDWTSGSGSGMMLGDGGGSHVLVKNNVLVNPGQVGIGIAGGSDMRLTGNTILGQPRAASNVGIYVWGQDAGCSNIQVDGNVVDFAKPSGAKSGGWDGGNCGAVGGWSSNDWTAGIGLDAVRVAL